MAKDEKPIVPEKEGTASKESEPSPNADRLRSKIADRFDDSSSEPEPEKKKRGRPRKDASSNETGKKSEIVALPPQAVADIILSVWANVAESIGSNYESKARNIGIEPDIAAGIKRRILIDGTIESTARPCLHVLCIKYSALTCYAPEIALVGCMGLWVSQIATVSAQLNDIEKKLKENEPTKPDASPKL